jgi:hypothetical protein
MISSVKHKIDLINNGKNSVYQLFLKDYSDFTIKVVEHIWRFGYKDFSIKNENLSLPKFINYKDFQFY